MKGEVGCSKFSGCINKLTNREKRKKKEEVERKKDFN